MIEMLQQTKIQAGNSPKNTTKAEHVNHDSQPSAKSDSSFDQHLNEQIQRAPTKEQQSVASKKTVENQSTEEVTSETVAEDSMPLESIEPTVITDEIIADTEVDVSDLLMVNVADMISEEGVETNPDQTLTEQTLPLDGNELPPDAVANIINMSETSEPAQEAIKLNISQQVAKPMNETHLAQQQGVAVVTKPLTNQEQPIQQSMFSEEVVEFDMLEMKMQTGQQNGMTQTVGGKLNALFASVAAAASMNQQVPVTTGVSPLFAQAAQLPSVDNGFLSLPSLSAGIQAPVQQHGAWAQGLTDQMALMVQGKLQTAEMKLNPAHLGPMEIKLSMHDDKASVTFVTQHAAVREALDVAMPRLREMFESQGLNLANVDVSQYSDQHGNPSDQLAERSANGSFGQDVVGSEQGSVVHESIIHINGHPGLSLYA